MPAANPVITRIDQIVRGTPVQGAVPVYDATTHTWVARTLTGVDLPAVVNGDASYVHEQAVAARIWIIDHGLNKYPVIQCFEDRGTGGIYEMDGLVVHLSTSQSRVEFNPLVTGFAVCS